MRNYIKVNEMYIEGRGWVKFYGNENDWSTLYYNKDVTMVNLEYVNTTKICNDEIVTTGNADVTIEMFNELCKNMKRVELREEIAHKEGNRKNFKLVTEYTVFGGTKKVVEKYLKLKNIKLSNNLVLR